MTYEWPDVPRETPEQEPLSYPCPHGCTNHRVPSLDATACGHYHSPTEWGHHEQVHNSDYWAAIGAGK